MPPAISQKLYNPGQLRKPSGAGRESGRWTKPGDGGDSSPGIGDGDGPASDGTNPSSDATDTSSPDFTSTPPIGDSSEQPQ